MWLLTKAQIAINLSQGDRDGLSNKNFTNWNYIWMFLGSIIWLGVTIALLETFGMIDLT
jgi:hypothetical protein